MAPTDQDNLRSERSQTAGSPDRLTTQNVKMIAREVYNTNLKKFRDESEARELIISLGK